VLVKVFSGFERVLYFWWTFGGVLFYQKQPTQQVISSLQPVEQSLLNLGIIFIEDDFETASPLLYSLYTDNRELLQNEDMVRIASADSVYYMRLIEVVANNVPLSVLLYTDVSPVVNFQNSMNFILRILLVVAGALALSVSAVLSARFKRAIKKISDYADAIGRGNFSENVTKFKHREFEQLGVRMKKMASTLQAYDDTQKLFFQNASHELRTPLMSIQGYAEGIVKDVFDKDEAAEIIIAKSKKMEALVSGILHISRLDSGLEATNTEYPVNIKNLINDCYEKIRVVAEKSNIRICFDIPEQDISIITDDEKLEVVISNVFSNAIRHAQSEIKVSCAIEDNGLCLYIQDDGEGIDEEDMPHIFNRFYKGKKGNAGLGLAISKEITESLGGQITAENLPLPQQGAKFLITLPLTKPNTLQ
jgi:signal transduction histidine kinase